MTVFGNASSRRTARNDLVVVPDTCGAPPGRRPSGYEDVRWKRVISDVIAAPVAHGSIVPFDRRQNARASAKAGKRIRHTDDFPRMTEIRIDGLTGSGEGFRGSAAAGGQGDGHDAKAGKRRPGSGGREAEGSNGRRRVSPFQPISTARYACWTTCSSIGSRGRWSKRLGGGDSTSRAIRPNPGIGWKDPSHQNRRRRNRVQQTGPPP